MRNEEARLRAALWQYYLLRKAPGSILFPNGDFRNVIIAVKGGHPFAIKLKSATGYLPEAETDWLIEAGAAGVRCAVARSFDEAAEYLKEFQLVR